MSSAHKRKQKGRVGKGRNKEKYKVFLDIHEF